MDRGTVPGCWDEGRRKREDRGTLADSPLTPVARTGNSRRSVSLPSAPLPTSSDASQYTYLTVNEIACAQTKPCAAFKHHFDECTERVLSGKTHIKGEDCVEELCTSLSSPPCCFKGIGAIFGTRDVVADFVVDSPFHALR